MNKLITCIICGEIYFADKWKQHAKSEKHKQYTLIEQIKREWVIVDKPIEIDI